VELAEKNSDEVAISIDVAQDEFQRFANEWDIDTDTSLMESDDKEDFNKLKRKIVREIMKGNATVDTDGNISYKLKYPKGEKTDLDFRIPLGKAYMNMDNYKEKQGMHKMFSFIGSLIKMPSGYCSSIDARDLKFCLGVATLFLAS